MTVWTPAHARIFPAAREGEVDLGLGARVIVTGGRHAARTGIVWGETRWLRVFRRWAVRLEATIEDPDELAVLPAKHLSIISVPRMDVGERRDLGDGLVRF